MAMELRQLLFLFVCDDSPVAVWVSGFFFRRRHPRKWRRRHWGGDDDARCNGSSGIVIGEDRGQLLEH